MLSRMLLVILLVAEAGAVVAQEREWRFRVYLDDKEIGSHDFFLEQAGQQLKLQSEASFEYRLVFVKLFGYEHRNTETWRGNCLTAIESRTDTNGKTYQVSGSLEGDAFVLNGTSGELALPGCSMSFAYWNPALLQQEQLINTQNGEVVEIVVSEPQRVELEVRGIVQPAYLYQLGAGEMQIELWYSVSHEWLALETEARGGRRLRYQLL